MYLKPINYYLSVQKKVENELLKPPKTYRIAMCTFHSKYVHTYIVMFNTETKQCRL